MIERTGSSSEPIGQPASEGTTTATVAVLLESDRDSELLADWLRDDYEVVLADDPSGVESTIDLCILDLPTLMHHADSLTAWKDNESPAFLPFLLVTTDPDQIPADVLRDRVDEVVDLPVERARLRVRLDSLLERRRLSKALARRERHSRERFATLFETVPDPILVFNDDGITAINAAFERLTGYDRESFEGTNLADHDAFPDETVAALDPNTIDANDGVDGRFEVQYRTRDGKRRYASVSAAPADASNHDVVVVLRDVTESKRNLRELERQNERLDTFAGMLAHELRNPLEIAQGYLQLFRSDGEEGHLERVVGAHTRITKMIDQILQLARNGGTVEEPMQIRFDEIVRMAWSRTDTDDATLVVDDTDAKLACDPDRLSRVFENLFRNAVEHGSTSPPSPHKGAQEDAVEHGSTSPGSDTRQDAVEHGGPTVEIRVGWLDDGNGFYVEDNGPGIPPADHESIFESGYSTGGEGMGLGLPIVKQVLDAHGWTPRIVAGSDGGARFEIRGVTPK